MLINYAKLLCFGNISFILQLSKQPVASFGQGDAQIMNVFCAI